MGRPTVTTEISLTPAPFDPAGGVASWTDISSYVRRVRATLAGRQYERGTSEAGTADYSLLNSDGRFDPDNGSSPYSPNLKLYRRIRTRATWNAATYDIWSGFVERYPQAWEGSGVFGTVPLVAVDALAVLAGGRELAAVYAQEVLADAPIAYYPLSEPVDSTSFGSLAATPQPVATLVDSKYGGATVVVGADPVAPADSATSVELSAANGVTHVGSVIQLSHNGVGPYVDSGSGTGWSFEIWFVAPGTLTDVGILVEQLAASSSSIFENGALRLNADGTLRVRFGATHDTTTTFDDSLPHHAVLAVAADGASWKLYVDGVQELSVTESVGSSNLPQPGWLLVGGLLTPTAQQEFLGAGGAVRVGHVAIYRTPLSLTRAAAHHTAGLDAFAGDGSGARVTRILDWARYVGTTAIDTGSSVLSGATTIAGQNPLAAVQDVAEWEAGALIAAADGTTTFYGRSARYNLSSVATFGPDPTAGEISYLDDLTTDFDPTTLINRAEYSQIDGVTVAVEDNTSIEDYGLRRDVRTLGVSTALEVADAANYAVGRNKDPRRRCSSIRVRPEKGDTWATMLALKFGDRVTVKVQPWFGTQPDQSLDCIVEQVSHDITPDDWVVELQLSPADTEQYWIAGDTVLSVAGATTRPGY